MNRETLPDYIFAEHNPLYIEGADRAVAEYIIMRDSIPIIRRSSREGFYAITCRVFTNLVHVLFRQNADGTIDILDDSYVIQSSYKCLTEFLYACTIPMGESFK
jgi:hypothetical protein